MIKKYIPFLSFMLVGQVMAKTVGSEVEVAKQGKTYFSNEASNYMAGFSVFKKGFQFQNALTSCIYSAYFPVSGDIVLNGGTLQLQTDLQLQSPYSMSGGTIDGRLFSMTLPHNVSSNYLPTLNHEKALCLVSQKSFSKKIYSLDWSYDSKYVAIGFDASNSINELQIFELQSDDTLLLKASYNFGNSDDVRAVRWHPSSYYLITGSISGNELRSWLFDPDAPSVTEVDNVNTNDVISLEWSPDGNYVAIGKNSTSTMYVYPVTNGLFGTAITVSLGSNVRIYGIGWKSTGDYLSLGLRKISSAKELRVFSFNGSTLSLDAELEINANVYCCQWRPGDNVLSAGISTSSDQLKTYLHSNSSLTGITSALVGETKTIFDLAWRHDGCFLATAKDTDSNGSEIELFCYDAVKKEFHMVSGNELSVDGTSVRWSPNGDYVAVGDGGGTCSIFKYDYRPLRFLDTKIILDTKTFVTGPVHFSGDCIIKGNGHVIDLGTTGTFIAEDGTLVIQDAILKGVGLDNIRCNENDCTIVLNDVVWLQDNDVTFTTGALTFENDVVMRGAYIFAYQSSQTSTLKSEAELSFDSGFTFSYDPITADKNLLCFENDKAVLTLDNASFHTTIGGIQLKTGTIHIIGNAAIESEIYTVTETNGRLRITDNGITIGDGIDSGNDVKCTVSAGSELKLSEGTLFYNNMSPTKWIMESDASRLTIATDSRLYLKKTLTLSTGSIVFNDRSILDERNAQFNGSVFARGYLKRIRR